MGAIVPIQAVIGTHPQKSVAVVQQAGGYAGRKAILLPNVAKFDI